MLATRGMTIAELARRSGINRSTLSGYINHGPGNIGRGTVVLIAEALGAPVGEALAAVGGLAWVIPESESADKRAADPELDLIMMADVSREEKLKMIDRYMLRRREDLERRLAQARYELELEEIEQRYRDQRDVG